MSNRSESVFLDSSFGTNPSSVDGSPASIAQVLAPAGLSISGAPHTGGKKPSIKTPQSFQCPHCSQSRSTTSLLNRHIKSHTRPYVCSFPGCRVRTAEQRDLDRHQDIHGKIRLYFCPVAGCPYGVNGSEQGFSRRLDNAKRHLKSHDNHHDMSVLREDSQGRLLRV